MLSGGNQQKVALGKWLSISPKVILGERTDAWRRCGRAGRDLSDILRDLADQGAAIVVASTDIQEITNLPDRIISFYRGVQIGELQLDDMTSANILEQITDPFHEAGIAVSEKAS